MTPILDALIGVTRPERRREASATLAAMLGGTDFLLFVRDEAVDALLPAPGYPQTLPDARTWRGFLAACVADGESGAEALRVPGGATVPAYGFSCGPEGVAVVLGAAHRPRDVGTVCELLPFLVATIRGERAAAAAAAQARVARESAAHAAALARALDGARAQLQHALAQAGEARVELEGLNAQLRTQADEVALRTVELQQANRALEHARVEADAANQAKSEFLATMSHELRTPLNAIGGYLQLVQFGIYGEVTPQQRDVLARIDRSQRHLLGIINQILNFARVESGQLAYRRESVVIAHAMRDLEEMIQPQLEAKALRYVSRLPDTRLRAVADREKLLQVLLNLLSNAIKFTARGGVIQVEGRLCAEHPATVAIVVRDTGIGIPRDRLDEVFEPFVQVDSSHSREGQGTGLGLAISRELARGMGGDLVVASGAGEGSTFTLRLPAAEGAVVESRGD